MKELSVPLEVGSRKPIYEQIYDYIVHEIEIVNYEFDGKNYKGTIRYKIYDHFGLDTKDVNAFKRIPVLEKKWAKYGWIPGFASWFVLQRYENCEEKYKPYVTYITIEEDFEGSID